MRAAILGPILGLCLTTAASAQARGLAFRRGAIFFISDNNVRRGELIAEVLIGHRFFIKQQTRVEQA